MTDEHETTRREKRRESRARIPEELREAGGLRPGAAREVARKTGIPEAEIYGVGSFFHLLADPETRVRVCTGLSCQLDGAEEVLTTAKAEGLPVEGCSCLAACDKPPAVLVERRVVPGVRPEDLRDHGDDWDRMERASRGIGIWKGIVGPEVDDPESLAMNLHGEPDWSGSAFARSLEIGADEVLAELEASGLQGRGGAGFPAHVKWKTVRSQDDPVRYVVLNADEGEPGTFKDREVLLRRPDLVLEGLAIAAAFVGAQEVYLYLRGEFEIPWKAVERAIAKVEAEELYPGLAFHMHAGHGAYICGEETALIEALEGKRGMPRLRPPFPAQKGLWDKPTLVHNVETIACVPAILRRGGDWFRELGRTEPGTKLYCVSGHVRRPGTYELPLGVTMDELAEAAGGYRGELKAFSPGGASSGFLPASERDTPLDFESLSEAGSMLGSGGVVVLNESVDMRWAAREQLHFFEMESCGQCAPCRIGTRYLRESVDGKIRGEGSEAAELAHAAEVAWEMNEGSICGLGQAAALPLTSALEHFPEEFES
ncbi:MAG: NADH-ubiquinone oxidoreductase-F iron-sulfur binding region domain-containing protein [Thermoanaerobaculia bacterium]|nr:NADH-ubiquinone oxidoreductase-F iron-sulfur binding region domain-containing protein [Thermoanaerobaculia bacterium]